ncbi:MAG TPA: hypothetical protein VD769_08335 [Gaiellaceae bacterium]|nr:hypothetical protein [Gaiellaceae bacterium]
MIAVAAWSSAPAAGTTPGTGGECPSILPLDQVSVGMKGTAVSVTRGRSLSTLGVEVLGVLRDAVGPGRDIVVVDLSGTAVTAAGGLWAGASGSPVYFRSGGKDRLAGAIAYGLASGGSTLAGVTPAQDLADLLAPGTDARSRSAVRVPAALATRMAAASGLSVTQTASMTRLKTPLSASGLTDRGLRQLQASIDRQGLPFMAYMGGSASNKPPLPTARLRAGDSFAAAMSLGDVTVAGIGTTTFVCDGQAVAFGHPFNWTGDTRMAIRAADTITIVKDPILGSYKLANVAESLGTLTQDRLAGIVGTLGDAPATSPITSTVTDLDLGRTRSGTSEAVFPGFLPFLAFTHLFQNVDVTIDRIGGGSSEVGYTIRGTRDGGATWELTRSTRFASPDDISFDSVVEIGFAAQTLQEYDGEEIEVTSIDVPTLEVKKAYERYNLKRLLVWNGSRYVVRDYVAARPGRTVRLRAVLQPVHRSGTKNVNISLRVPANARRSGYIEVLGGGTIGPEIPCFIVEEECVDDTNRTFDQLLNAFRNQPPGDALVARLRLGDAGILRAQSSVRQDAVVGGRLAIGFLLRR